MNSKPADLWHAWRSNPGIRGSAEAWLIRPEGGRTEEDELLAGWIHSEPERAQSMNLG